MDEGGRTEGGDRECGDQCGVHPKRICEYTRAERLGRYHNVNYDDEIEPLNRFDGLTSTFALR